MIGKKRYKTPVILQMEAAECGAAALAIVLAYYQCHISLEELRVACGVSRDGTRALNMVKAGGQYGIDMQGLQVDKIDELKILTGPVILFWQFNHFVVLEGIKGEDKFYMNDPAHGHYVLDRKSFSDSFTGVCLTAKPNKNFKKQGRPASLWAAMKSRLSGSGNWLKFIILATLLLVLPGIIVPGFSLIFIDNILVKNQSNWLLPLVWGMFFTAILRGLLVWLQQTMLLRLQLRLFLSTSTYYLWHLLRLPLNFFIQRFAGDIIERFDANSRIIQLLSEGLSANIVNLISIVFFAIVMLLLSWQLACIVFMFTLLSFILFRLVALKIAELSRRFLQQQGKLSGIEMNGLQIIETLKSSNNEQAFFSRWSGQYAMTLNSQWMLMVYNQILTIGPQLLFALSNIAVLGVGAWQIMRGDLTVGTLVAIQSLAMSFLTPINALINLWNSVQQIHGDLTRLDDVLAAPQQAGFATKTADNQQIQPLEGAISLTNVHFGFAIYDDPMIVAINLNIHRQENVIITGVSGSGKSTLARLLTGLYTPWQGKIEYDNIAIEDIPRSVLTKSVAFVDQEFSFFRGTLLDNLTLWDKQYDTNAIQHALKQACAWDFLSTRGGVHALIEEGGVNFSAGEQQRIELARVFLQTPSILILDEATSAINPQIEAKIVANLQQLNCTIIMITHRLSLLKQCEKLLVMDQGKIVQQGSFDSLMKQAGALQAIIGMEESND